MATKAQKRVRMQAKRAEREEALRQEGLAALQADQEKRAKAIRDAKIQTSKELREKHDREKNTRKDISDAQRESQAWSDLTSEQRLNYTVAAGMLRDTTV